MTTVRNRKGCRNIKKVNVAKEWKKKKKRLGTRNIKWQMSFLFLLFLASGIICW